MRSFGMDDHDYNTTPQELDAAMELEWTVPPNPDWLLLNSVGIDIGSSTTHLMFSRLILRRKGLELSSRFVVVKREVLYRSPILFTPYRDSETIDTAQLSEFIAHSYQAAGIDPAQVDTGAVICTGEAAKKQNAEAITRLFSAQGGKFVCATAGPRLEGNLAAHGSGAVARSESHGTVVMNVDVGGGTCKATIVQNGKVIDTGAINVGARLVAWNAQGQLVRVEETARKVARHIGIALSLGHKISDDAKRALAWALSDALFDYLRRGALSRLASEILITEPLSYAGAIDEISFSGGVGEYVYGHDRRDYGDLGPLLGEEIRARLPSLNIPLRKSAEQIRATVIGASQYTIQVSSSTIFLSRRDLLPLWDFQVITPHLDMEHTTTQSIANAIHRALERFDLNDRDNHRRIALSLHWQREPSYHSLHLLASGIASALQTRNDDVWVLVFDRDIGGLVGSLLKRELQVQPEVVAVDEIEVGDFDFVDIGQELRDAQAVPVVVKSLVFDQSNARAHARRN